MQKKLVTAIFTVLSLQMPAGMTAALNINTPNADDVPKPLQTPVSLAGSKKPDISRFLNIRKATQPLLSPDGLQLAYQTGTTGISQIWIIDQDGSHPRQLTFGQPITFHAWSPDGKWIVYGTDRGGDEREGFYLISPDGTQEQEILPPSDAYRKFGGFTDDGQSIAYATTERNGIDFDIHLRNIYTGEDQQVFEGRMGLYAVSWRPGSNGIILTESRGEDAHDVYYFDVQAKKLTPLFKPEERSEYTSFNWTPDGRGFYVVTNQDNPYMALAYYEMSSGKLSFIETPDHDIEQAALSSDGRYLSWVTNVESYSTLSTRDLKTGKIIKAPELPKGIYTVSWAGNSNTATISVSGISTPGDVWNWQIEDKKLNRVTFSSLAGLDVKKLVKPTSYTFDARDGIKLQGLLYMPAGVTPDKKPPVVLMLHGGPTSQARPVYNPMYQYLLTRGIAIFDLNYRGSTGFGKVFARLNDQHKRAAEIYDLADTMDWLKNQGKVDASKAAVMGRSYGGYLTMAAMTQLADYFDAGVATVGVSDWVTALEGANPDLKADDRIEYGNIDDLKEREFFKTISPIYKTKNIKAPMLIEHGVNDTRDPVTESDQFVRAIREQGGEVEYLRFPGEGHRLRKQENIIISGRRKAQFLESKLKS